MRLVQWLRIFNQIRDDLLMELSSSVLLIGFAVGTVDVLTRGGWTSNQYFQTGWAVVQALTIDVLFFAVWGRIGRASWRNWKDKTRNVVMIFVGTLLAGVAALVNGLVNIQQLMNLPSIAAAMTALHIDQTFFTTARSILIVMVAILIALFGRSQQRASGKPIEQPAEQPKMTAFLPVSSLAPVNDDSFDINDVTTYPRLKAVVGGNTNHSYATESTGGPDGQAAFHQG